MKFFKNIIFSIMLLILSITNVSGQKLGKQLYLNSDKTLSVKKFPDNFPDVLTERGKPLVYNKGNSNHFEYVGMPVGGIGAGQLYLGGDGVLWFWDIFNTNKKIGDIKGEDAYQYPYKRSELGKFGTKNVEQGFAIRIKSSVADIIKSLDRSDIDSIEFLGQYPVGNVKYKDKELPVEIEMEAFSPFIPLSLDKSSLPATIFIFKIKNISNLPVNAELTGWLDNVTCIETRHNGGGFFENSIKKFDEDHLRISYNALPDQGFKGALEKRYDFGSMSFTLLNASDESRAVVNLNRKKIPVSAFSSEESQEIKIPFGKFSPVGALTENITLAPSEEKQIKFILTWHFPNTQVPKFTKHQYAVKYPNALAISDFVINNFDPLMKQTILWHDTWYDSSLPYWFLDRTFLNTSILASSTFTLNEDGRVHGWEGGYQGHGTCTHVWGYVQAMGRLFPELENRLREKTDFIGIESGGAMMDDGIIQHRAWSHGLAVDGQSGIILRSYLAHQMSPDNSFLNRNYLKIKKAMTGLIDARDADHNGILTGPQHNTLDAAWYGEVTWLSLYYQAALRAMSEMAEETGDKEYSVFCRSIADKGRSYIENNLFNGEYFFHKKDPNHPESPGIYTGCEYSQLLGQSWAYQVGLGSIIDSDKVSTALKSLWKYNFTTDVGTFRKSHPAGRWFAMPGEGGLIACTWPRGGYEVLEKGNPRFAAYNNECQNGYEYACTSAMMWHGMPENALAHIWYLHNNRYHGSKRNPWCEIEWGIHYSRSMASYGHFVAACGYEYNGPKGYIAFGPQFNKDNFKASFVAAEGWGNYQQNINKNKFKALISLKYGKLSVKSLAFEFPKKAKKVLVDGESVDFEQYNEKVNIKLNRKKLIKTDEQLEIIIQ